MTNSSLSIIIHGRQIVASLLSFMAA
uniref:Uncharacterized protein n=1 Tax=Rhizophora mucronata TaxID=61149 RepID=A0A2P2IS54_RHIMU